MKKYKRLFFAAILLAMAQFSIAQELFSPAYPAPKYEVRGVWLTTLGGLDWPRIKATSATKREQQKQELCQILDQLKAAKINTVFMQTRIRGAVIYPSKIEPWDVCLTGQYDKDPGYDPLAFAIEETHKRGMELHAWVVTVPSFKIKDAAKLGSKSLLKTHPELLKKHNDMYYLDPGLPGSDDYLVGICKEIVSRYDVDGIHFDDYFYPALGSKYETMFDAQEYEAYKKKRKAAGKKVLSIDKWRMYNVNTLVKEVYSAIKETRSDCIFGISPGGYIDYFDDKDRWYVDYRTWMKEDGYVDYICPQLYWSFNNRNIFPFYDTLLAWAENLQNENVKLYVGLPAYKMNERNVISSQDSLVDTEWYNQYLLADMVRFLRRSGKASGFIVFDYSDLVTSKNAKAAQYMKEEIEG